MFNFLYKYLNKKYTKYQNKFSIIVIYIYSFLFYFTKNFNLYYLYLIQVPIFPPSYFLRVDLRFAIG